MRNSKDKKDSWQNNRVSLSDVYFTFTLGIPTRIPLRFIQATRSSPLNSVHRPEEALGGTLDDVVRTRIYLRDAGQWEPVARVHGRYFHNTRPANTLVEASLVGDYDVEIEAEALLG